MYISQFIVTSMFLLLWDILVHHSMLKLITFGTVFSLAYTNIASDMLTLQNILKYSNCAAQ